MTQTIKNPTKYKSHRECGYSKYNKHFNNSRNIGTIPHKTLIAGNAVAEYNYSTYNANLVDIESIFNPPNFKSLITNVSGNIYGIANVTFGTKKIQFVAVDGNSLTEPQYLNASYVISQYNTGNLPIINFTSGSITNTDKYNFDGYTAGIWFTIYMYETFGRAGIYDTTSTILSVVNVNFTNAFWNGLYMTYGNGIDSINIGPLTTLDIVGHEMMHGITQFTNDLIYQREPGAINESISDIFGTTLEIYYDTKSGKNLSDWYVGEDTFPGALRSLQSPKVYGQPDTYLGTYWFPTNIPSDNGGVHTNSGVGNYLFYISCVPSTGTNDFGRSYSTTTAIPVQTLAEILFITLTGQTGYRKLKTTSSYNQMADDLYHNTNLFVTNNSLNTNFTITIDQAISAVNLRRSRVIIRPPTIPNRQLPRYRPRNRIPSGGGRLPNSNRNRNQTGPRRPRYIPRK